MNLFNHWVMSFAPFFGWGFWYLCALIGASILAVFGMARLKGLLLRALTLTTLLAALANPTLRQDERQGLSDIAVIVVDDSTSQTLGNRAKQTEEALIQLKERLSTLSNVEIRTERVSSGTTPETDGTRLFTALERAKSEIPPERYAGAFFLTDGQVHDVPKTFDGSAPLHALLSGNRTDSDRRVVILQAPRFAISGQEQNVTFTVEDLGFNGSVAVTATLPDGTTRLLDVPSNTPQQIPFIIDHAGQNLLELEAEKREGEVSLENNRAMALIQGIRDRLRVLLVSGQPHVGERTWRNLLKADASVDLVHFTILRPPEKQDGTPTKELSLIAFPTRELFVDKIKEFDLVIFDRYRREAILPDEYFANIADYVRQGGSVLVASGPDYASEDGLGTTPLAEILPAVPTGGITEQGFKPMVTANGAKHPVTQNLTGSDPKDPKWGRWFRIIDATVADEREVLMSGPEGKPLLVMTRVGEGRVTQFLSDHGWLWARGFEGGGPQMELLRRIAHWNMKEPDLEEEALTAKQQDKFIIVERRTIADTVEPVTVRLPSGKSETVTLTQTRPGLFAGRIELKEIGIHRFNDSKVTTAAAIGSAEAKEMSDINSTETILRPITVQSGGGIVWMSEGLPRIAKQKAGTVMAGSGFLAVKNNEQFRVTAVRELPLFTTLLSLVALLLFITGMWYSEGR